MQSHIYYTYLLASRSGTLYVGVTNDLQRRMREHKSGQIEGCAKKYGVNKLVYYEEYQYIEDAIAREKQIKGWGREKKLALFREINPTWDDLSAGWFVNS